MAMSQVKRLTDIIRNEVGYIEKKSSWYIENKTKNTGHNNYTKYGKWFGIDGPDTHWSHMFLSWCAHQCGFKENIIPKTANCYDSINFFKGQQSFYLRGKYIPKEGNLIYFSSSRYPDGGDHVGYICNYDGRSLTVVEVKASVDGYNAVIENEYNISCSEIYGFSCPKYSEPNAPFPVVSTNNLRYIIAPESDFMRCFKAPQMDSTRFRKLYKGYMVTSNKKCGEWTYMAYSKGHGWVPNEWLLPIAQPAIDVLYRKGIIDNPSHWLIHFSDIDDLDLLLSRFAKVPLENTLNFSIQTIEEAFEVLHKKRIISSCDYWMKNYHRVEFLETLIIKVAARI